MKDKKTYKFEYCFICKRQLIVQKIDGWTGRELPNDEFYICEECKRKQKEEQQQEHKLIDWPPWVYENILLGLKNALM